jgi:hypothetical protein
MKSNEECQELKNGGSKCENVMLMKDEGRQKSGGTARGIYAGEELLPSPICLHPPWEGMVFLPMLFLNTSY